MKNILKLEDFLKVRSGIDKQIILVGGCFDILHPGHLHYLQKAKKIGGVLVVVLENDEKVRLLKGEGRPVNKEKTRAKNLAKLDFVDFVVILPVLKNDQDYFDLVGNIRPAVIALTHGHPQIVNIRKQAKLVGALVVEVTKRIKQYSTSKIMRGLT